MKRANRRKRHHPKTSCVPVSFPPFHSVVVPADGRIIAYGFGNNDSVTLNSNVAVPVFFDGDGKQTTSLSEGGNDSFYGGSGNDSIWGNVGDDTVDGKGGLNEIDVLAGTDVISGDQNLSLLHIGDELHPGNFATARFSSAGLKTILAQSVAIETGSTLDLNDGELDIDYSSSNVSPATDVSAWLNSGYNSAGWDGTGISSFAAQSDSSRAVGWKDDSVGRVLTVKYTYYGDANLDGKVDIVDLGILAGNWQLSAQSWSQGDFNYDGTVNIVDLGLLAGNWQAGVTSPMSLSARRTAFRNGIDSLGLSSSAVAALLASIQ